MEYGAGSITFTGQDVINAFNTLKNSQNGNDGGGGDDKDKDKKKEEKKKEDEKDPSLAKQFVNGIPVIGPALQSGDKLSAGDYWGAAGDFGTALAEMFTFGFASEVKLGVSSIATVAEETVTKKAAGTSLTRLLESLGTNTKNAASFFGWGNRTALTKSISDFTKEELLENNWTKQNLVKLARAYNDQVVKAQLAGASNPAAVVRRDQAIQLARHFFGN